MSLQQLLAADSVGQTASIIFNDPALVDQVSFGSNQITMAACTAFTLTKADLILYGQYLTQFNNTLLVNFPSIALSINGQFPLSNFQISKTFSLVNHLKYTQTSGANTVYTINYTPSTGLGTFIARASPVVITLPEFYMCIYMLQQFIAQVSLN